MQNNLFLRRLIIITDENKTAYDETFHQGVNIIRGQNSSGKSTIIRFIFYVLGGCYSDFVPEAMKCRYVMAEVEINGTVLTLKRYLEKTDDGRVNKYSPMYIHYGTIDEVLSAISEIEARQEKSVQSVKSKWDLWQKYGYKMTSDRRSFSNVLFDMMGLPEFKADSNITMHQILRLIYLDQESPLSSLFFFDIFDKEIIRETVAELLMGLYDENLSNAKLSLLALNRRQEEIAQTIKITKEFLSDSTMQSPAFITAQIERLAKEMQDITEQVKALREGETVKKVKIREYQKFQTQVARLRSDFVKLEDEIARLKADIQDSTFFIEALQKKIDALERSIATRDYFDSLHLEFCPECLTRVDDSAEPGHCRLCKSPVDNSKGKSQAMRIKLELDFQIRESKSLLKENSSLLQEKEMMRRSLQRELAAAQKQYDTAVQNVRSSQDEQIDQLIQDRGYKEGEMSQYRTMLEQAERYEQLLAEQAALKERQDQLNRYIQAAESKIKANRSRIEQTITANGLYLLKNDQDRQAEFRNATDFRMNFKQNMAYLTDQHIKLSASSSFYLKMTARFALLFASIQNDTMRYPRLLFSDNMEDKGMEEDRARNFQRIVVKHLNDMPDQDYQLIFATSNIAEELNIPEYTVGDYYTRDNKSLKNVN